MRKKELKNLAAKIAKYEKIIQVSQDKKEIAKAQEEIMKLSNDIDSLDDMMNIDELVMELLEKNS